MPRHECEIPIRVRLIGRPTAAALERLEAAVAARVAAAVARSGLPAKEKEDDGG